VPTAPDPAGFELLLLVAGQLGEAGRTESNNNADRMNELNNSNPRKTESEFPPLTISRETGLVDDRFCTRRGWLAGGWKRRYRRGPVSEHEITRLGPGVASRKTIGEAPISLVFRRTVALFDAQFV
jgi:hypothetical protein